MRLILFFSSIFFMYPELISAKIDIVLIKKASINKIYSSKTVYLNSGDKFRFLIRSEKSDKFDITLSTNSEVKKIRIKIDAGEEVYAPKQSEWYTYNENYESVKISVKNNFLSTEMVVKKLIFNNYDNSLLESLLKDSTENGKFKNVTNFHLDDDPPVNITSVTTKKRMKTRSISNETLFNNVSQQVILITAGEDKGSGIVISEDGLILTNWHVVEGFKNVEVTFRPPDIFSEKVDPSNQYIADVLFTDKIADLATVKLRNDSKVTSYAKLGIEKDIRIAKKVHSIGHPFGEGWTYTTGSIGNYKKNYPWTADNIKHKADVILTGARIHPGSSGGPLISEEEKILGINTFIKNQEHNFAVSVSTIRNFLEEGKNKVTPVHSGMRKRRTEKIDYDNDGTTDGERIDYNDNGKWDCIALDKNKDGRYEEWRHDRNENDIFDLYIREEFKEGGGITYIWSYDTDEDGMIGDNDCYREDNDLDLRAEETRCN